MTTDDTQRIFLTQTVQKGGCAAKVAADELRKILSIVSFPLPHSEVIVDGSTFDDAAVYRIDASRALVQTLDFFTPIVDSPKLFGSIAATNALSDVYAMGGIPKTAMVILAFPLSQFPTELVAELMQGVADKVKEAGACIVGGHSIDDETLKCGLSVTGYVHPENVWTNAGAKIGDTLILTKPLGTGTATAALKRRVIHERDIEDVLESMMRLNNVPEILSIDEINSVHGATDITGFGLAGHLMQLAQASNVSLDISTGDIPVFERTEEFIQGEYLTKAHKSNERYTLTACETSSLSAIQRNIIYDPQTSGGLVLSVAADRAKELLATLRARFQRACVIGSVEPQGRVSVRF